MTRPAKEILIPVRFLTLIAHLSIVLTLLWSSKESLKICLPEEHSQRFYSTQHKQFVVGMSLSITLIIAEMLAFLLGLTIFSQTSALLSVFSHFCASLSICYLVVESLECSWYWPIFAFFTLPPALYDAGWTPLLVLAGASTTIGSSLTVGYNIGVMNSPAELIKVFCNKSIEYHYGITLGARSLDIVWSAVISIFLVGGAIGSLSGSWFADKFGRKGSVIVSILFAVMSGVCFLSCKPAESVELLILGRLLVGLSSGLATCVVPMYLTELAPLKLRGAVGVLCPLGVTVGVLVGQVMSLRDILGQEDTWHYLISMYLLFIALSSVALPFLPESPKYLYIVKKQTLRGLKQLERIRNREQQYLTSDILELQAEQPQDKVDEWSLGRILRTRELLLPILLVCSMQAGQQFVGINAVFYYSASIFRSAGLSETNSELATIGAGVVNFAMAVISIPVMSRLNRRIVIQISCISASIFLAILGVAISYIATISWMPYLSIAGVLGFVMGYGFGLGPIPYFIGSELFEVGPRPSAMALGSMANWGGNFLIGMTFPLLQSYIGPASFFIFAIIGQLLFIFFRLYLPETRGRDPTIIAQLCKNGLNRPRPPSSLTNLITTNETTSSVNSST